MPAEKGPDHVSVAEFFALESFGDRLADQLDRLNTRHSNYCQETVALKQSLANGGRRQELRQARLHDLETRLLPQLQARLHSLQDQKIGLY